MTVFILAESEFKTTTNCMCFSVELYILYYALIKYPTYSRIIHLVIFNFFNHFPLSMVFIFYSMFSFPLQISVAIFDTDIFRSTSGFLLVTHCERALSGQIMVHIHLCERNMNKKRATKGDKSSWKFISKNFLKMN